MAPQIVFAEALAGLETSRDPLLDATENVHAYAESLAVRRGEAYAPPF